MEITHGGDVDLHDDNLGVPCVYGLTRGVYSQKTESVSCLSIHHPTNSNTATTHRGDVDLDDDDLEVVFVPPRSTQNGYTPVLEVVVHVNQPRVLSILAARRKRKRKGEKTKTGELSRFSMKKKTRAV